MRPAAGRLKKFKRRTNMNGQEKKAATIRRYADAVALREGDRIPVSPIVQGFPYYRAGYTIADVVYDDTLEKSKEAVMKYLNDFDPDLSGGFGVNDGMGKIYEKINPYTTVWAGKPGAKISPNSIHQWIEFPLLLDGEFEEFYRDRTGWSMNKAYPRMAEVFEGFKNISFTDGYDGFVVYSMIAQLSSPDFREKMNRIWEINDMYMNLMMKQGAIMQEIDAMGYPSFSDSGSLTPYDHYNDFLRGSILGMCDLYDNYEVVEQWCEENWLEVEKKIKALPKGDGTKWFQMALHKGFDGFMNDEHYEELYWKYLRKMIIAIIDSGRIPYVYTEGKYDSRIKFLSDVPKGKVIYHFEYADMEYAKKELGDVACISGGFDRLLLEKGTKQQVIDETKRLIDICAPGGGFIFETDAGVDFAKDENFEAMMVTAKDYGRY